jgi:hypothetical protein
VPDVVTRVWTRGRNDLASLATEPISYR